MLFLLARPFFDALYTLQKCGGKMGWGFRYVVSNFAVDAL